MSIRLDNVTAGRWCGGVHVTPREYEGAHALAATPAYLTADDLLTLLVFCMGEGASEFVDENVVRQSLTYASSHSTPSDAHDHVISYWDRQP